MGREEIDLPDSVEDLRALVRSLRSELNEQATAIEEKQALADERASVIDEQSDRIDFLQEAIRLLRAQRFATKSEKASRHQLGLFNEAEATVDAVEGDEEEVEVKPHKRRKGGRRPLPEELPRVEVVHDLSDAEKICPHDASHTLTRIGEEVSEQLDMLPAVLQVIRHVRPKYACSTCKEGVQIAPMPVRSQYLSGLSRHVDSRLVDAHQAASRQAYRW